MLPRSAESNGPSDADLAACRELLCAGSRTFYAASFMLPPAPRRAATALYAFCRLADDAVDVEGAPHAAHARLRERLDLAYAGRPLAIAADRAFAEVVRRYGIPQALPAALLEGFEWDACGRRYQTLSDLNAYAARVAGTVGAMMALLMGAHRPEVLARACDLGVAMQFTNIARDVGEDARAGRLYLPLEWLAEEGIEPDAWLAAPAFTPAIGRVVDRLLAAADELYALAGIGIGQLPASCRPGMQAARLLYAEIGHEVARRGFDSVSARARVPASRKARVLGRALLASLYRAPAVAAPALEETRFLVDAAAAARPPVASVARANPVEERVLWVLDLFERLERRDRELAKAEGQAGAMAV